jgi:predicted P-loop ATPase
VTRKKRETNNIVRLAKVRETEPEWLQQCMRNSKGAPIANVANVLTALRGEPSLSECFAFDMMMQTPMLMHPLPDRPESDFVTRQITDDDVTFTQDWLQHNGLQNIGREMMHQAISARSREKAFHPTVDYLKALQWNEVPRVDTWLHIYLGAVDNAFTRNVGRMFLISMVARVFSPGCKADHMLVLEGGQGEWKSTACSILAGIWFSETMPAISDGKDIYQHLRGKWLVEISEMHAQAKSEADAFKGFLSGTVDRYFARYGRMETTQPRQCVFIGTTNKSTYFTDETGNRRFWPVATTSIDVDALKRDRDQLFAEAVKLYLDGVPWWPTKDFEHNVIEPEQAARYEEDSWEHDYIEPYLRGKDRTTIGQIARDAFSIQPDRLGVREQRRISRCLRHLGWKDARTNAERFWIRGRNGTNV